MKTFFTHTFVKLGLGCFLIVLFALWIYHPTTKNLFVWDTNGYLINYEFWISKLNPYHIIWMGLSLEVFNWHPLTWLSWAIDYQLYGGLVPWGYHFSNNILHAFNSALLFILMLMTFGLNSSKEKGHLFPTDYNALSSALLAAVFFAAHPQHVESVAWVAERKDLLCQLFLLLSMIAYVKYVTSQEAVKKRWFLSVLGLFIMALLAKPMAVTFPVVLLLIDIYPLRRTTFIKPAHDYIKQQKAFYLLTEKLPFFLLSLLVVSITVYAQRYAIGNTPFELRLLNSFNSLILYLTKLLAPLDFYPHYALFVDAGAGEIVTWKSFLPVIGVAALTVAALFAWKKGHYAWLVSWLFYLVTLSPVLGIIQVGQQGAADRYAYLPTLPVYLLLGAGIHMLLIRFSPTKKTLFLIAAIPLIYLLADKTRQQIRVWESDLTLWTYALEYSPASALALNNLGAYYMSVSNYEDAAHFFEESIKLRPNRISPRAWRSLAFIELGHYEGALNDLLTLGVLIEGEPKLSASQVCIQYNIGWLLAQMSIFVESSELFNRIDPNSPLGKDATIWLNWLHHIDPLNHTTPINKNLPGICHKLLPSMG